MALILAVTSLASAFPMTMMKVSAEETSVSSKDYPVIEDAYIRSGGNANTNYNYENITKAHGSQYVDKNYRVVNIKNNGDEIMSVMKFQLPTKEEVVQISLISTIFNFIYLKMRIMIREIRVINFSIQQIQTGANQQ